VTTANLVTERHVLAALAGASPEHLAHRHGLDATDLADAVETYRTAGVQALERRTDGWWQARLRFTPWEQAEQAAATVLSPALGRLRHEGTITGWWFPRKHPYWRLRFRAPGTATALPRVLGPLFDTLIADGYADRWTSSPYEPETAAFGGSTGIDIAHRLFETDTQGVLAHLTPAGAAPSVGRREISVLLCTALFRAAGLDPQDQADVWHRVAQSRPPLAPPVPARLRDLGAELLRLIALDTTVGGLVRPGGPLAPHSGWFAGFTTAGRELADATRDGVLERGLRGTLASHVVFHWNRLGIPTTAQALLARTARDVLLDPPARQEP
jgi:thiopeptide-type bacteriocin biosynthesis protein